MSATNNGQLAFALIWAFLLHSPLPDTEAQLCQKLPCDFRCTTCSLWAAIPFVSSSSPSCQAYDSDLKRPPRLEFPTPNYAVANGKCWLISNMRVGEGPGASLQVPAGPATAQRTSLELTWEGGVGGK